jgi:hypothetical protein
MTVPVDPRSFPVVTDAGAFERWVQSARSGDLVVYATGRDLPRAAACVVLAREWERARLVTLRAYRLDDGRWCWVARKADAPNPTARAMNRFDESPATSVLRLIKRCVNFGLPCPTLAAMADVAGYAADDAGRAAARRIVQQLEGDGVIRVQNAAGGARRIIIERGAKSGKATGWLNITGRGVGAQ